MHSLGPVSPVTTVIRGTLEGRTTPSTTSGPLPQSHTPLLRGQERTRGFGLGGTRVPRRDPLTSSFLWTGWQGRPKDDGSAQRRRDGVSDVEDSRDKPDRTNVAYKLSVWEKRSRPELRSLSTTKDPKIEVPPSFSGVPPETSFYSGDPIGSKTSPRGPSSDNGDQSRSHTDGHERTCVTSIKVQVHFPCTSNSFRSFCLCRRRGPSSINRLPFYNRLPFSRLCESSSTFKFSAVGDMIYKCDL